MLTLGRAAECMGVSPDTMSRWVRAAGIWRGSDQACRLHPVQVRRLAVAQSVSYLLASDVRAQLRAIALRPEGAGTLTRYRRPGTPPHSADKVNVEFTEGGISFSPPLRGKET